MTPITMLEYAAGRDSATATLGRAMRTSATPIAASDAEIEAIRWNEDGLVPAIVQEAASGQVLMMAWVNEESLRRTLSEGRTVFWSRSRQELWRKGDTSGDRQWLRTAYYDCDGDVLLFVVEQEGRGACHTGEKSCFFRAFGDGSDPGPR
jgi:phosphoribosyl-AMP cyclohydrolase/phosphoribosyl-ATP pyrophosphohydrolase/phosphoribosyl-AMP cyclohydrolase